MRRLTLLKKGGGEEVMRREGRGDMKRQAGRLRDRLSISRLYGH
jgi:hypothetical protein